MMVAILAIARQPLVQYPFHDLAGRCDVHLLAHGAKTGWADLDESARRRYASAAVYDGYDTNDLLLRDASVLIEKQHVEHVVALSEVDLLRAGRLRDRHGLPGLGYADVLPFRDKIVMKERLRAAGVAVPRSRPVEDGLDVLDARAEYGLPFVVKPRLGGGAVGTTIVEDERRLDELLDRGLRTRFFLPAVLEAEEYVPGGMFHVDGLVLDGQVAMIWPSEYLTGALQHVDGVPSASVQLSFAHPSFTPLTDLTRRALDALGALRAGVDMYFHCEIFDSPDGLVLCEIAARPGGLGILDCLDARYGRSSFRLLMDRILAEDRAPTPTPVNETFGFIGVPPNRSMEEGLAVIPPDAVLRAVAYDRRGRRGRPSISVVDVEGTVCVRAPDAATLRSRLESMIQAYVRVPAGAR